MKRNILRKNIFIISIILVFVLLLLVTFKLYYDKQISTEKSLNKLKKENSQLKLKNEKLKADKDKYTSKVNSIQTQNEGFKKDIAKYQKTFEQLQADIKNELVNSLGIFSPDYTKKGDKVAGLTVSDVYSKDNGNGTKNYKIDFSGEFVVKGKIVPNMIGGGYTMIIQNNLEKLPHTLQEFNEVNLTFKNNDILRVALHEKINGLTNFNNLEIEAILKNYTYNYVPESDVHNTAEFVRLVN